MSECWLGESPYNCPDCDGGETFCEECGGERDCPECRGTGWNPDLVDVDAFKAASEALNERAKAAGNCALSCEWVENGVRLGRDGGEYGRVAVADFLLNEGNRTHGRFQWL